MKNNLFTSFLGALTLLGCANEFDEFQLRLNEMSADETRILSKDVSDPLSDIRSYIANSKFGGAMTRAVENVSLMPYSNNDWNAAGYNFRSSRRMLKK